MTFGLLRLIFIGHFVGGFGPVPKSVVFNATATNGDAQATRISRKKSGPFRTSSSSFKTEVHSAVPEMAACGLRHSLPYPKQAELVPGDWGVEPRGVPVRRGCCW